ncbi:MAG: NAD(P)-dependent oxidoreductase [Chloroflexi bacterium]|nr:NAD(P)-dependent oxidoreductase [Chloroflexota bacterium]
MILERIGIIHPGAMGISIAASAQNTGYQVYWASAGRSRQTQERAAKFGLRDAITLAQLCETCQLIVCVCPPHAAEEVAQQVVVHGYKGLYLDANAVAPQRAMRIGAMLHEAGALFVDGGIIGGPAWKSGETWLYLSGPQAQVVAQCFAAGPLGTSVIGENIGKASALKMCYAAYTKGTTALLCAILAAAEELQVRQELQQQWTRDDPEFAQQTVQRVRSATAKAWRFVGEMDEIAATLQGAGLPGEFHAGAANIYRRMAHLKDAPTIPTLEEVLAALLQPRDV